MSYDEAIFQMYLGEVPMFQACSEEELSTVAYLASPRALDAGTEIVREGDAGDDFFVLMMGTATASRQGHHVGNLEPGDFFGELALFDPAPRNATITADTPVTMAVRTRGLSGECQPSRPLNAAAIGDAATICGSADRESGTIDWPTCEVPPTIVYPCRWQELPLVSSLV